MAIGAHGAFTRAGRSRVRAFVDHVQGYFCGVIRLRDRPVEAPPGESAVAPVEIEGLPREIEALGMQWRRKVEFHMTVLAGAVIEGLGAGDPGVRQAITAMLGGRQVGPILVTREVRHVRHSEECELETIVVMVECPALEGLFEELSDAFGAQLEPPPAHVTLYSTDPERGIGINDGEQLRSRAPELPENQQREVRQAMDFDAVFGA